MHTISQEIFGDSWFFLLNLFVLHDDDVPSSLDLFNDAAHCFKISGKQERNKCHEYLESDLMQFQG